MNSDPMDLYPDEQKARTDASVRRTLDRESEGADIKWLMGSRRGRRIVWRLLEQAGVFKLSFNTNSMQMAFNEGNRNYGNRTLGLIHAHCPELYPVMVKENTHGSE